MFVSSLCESFLCPKTVFKTAADVYCMERERERGGDRKADNDIVSKRKKTVIYICRQHVCRTVSVIMFISFSIINATLTYSKVRGSY